MDQQNQNNNTPDGSGDVPLKRKRGRPRKYPRPDLEDSSYAVHSYNKKQNSASSGQAPVPPEFHRVNGNQHLQRNQENDSNDAMVGQAVSGVIEAVFDAGYLLSVRVGESDTTLRGLVFKPGRYVPISSENDVAPGVPMIRRNEVPFPSGNGQFLTPPRNERNEQNVSVNRSETFTMNGSPSVPQVPGAAVGSSNLVASLGKNVPSVAPQTTPQIARGNAVPVSLQPANFSNGVPVPIQPSQVMAKVSAGSTASVAKEVPVDGNQSLTCNTQSSQNILSSGIQSEGVPQNQSSTNSQNKEAKLAGVPGAPFEHLVTEVVKRMQTQSDAMDNKIDNSKLGDKTLLKDPSCRQEDKVNDMEQPILIKPLQAVQSHPLENLATAPILPDYTKTGKMTELLQILQDNKQDNQTPKAAELGSGPQLDDVRNLGTGREEPSNQQNLAEQ